MTKSALNSDLAVSARAVAAEARAPEAEQLDFLAPIVRHVNKHDQAALAQLATEARERRKRGRPPGAENIGSRQIRELVTRTAGGLPILQSAAWLALEPEEMALRLGISTVEAFDRQEAIRSRFDRLFVAPLAPTDQDGKAVPGIGITIGGEAINSVLAVSAGREPPWMAAFRDAEGQLIEGVVIAGPADGPVEENQGLSGSRSDAAGMEGGNGSEKR